MSHSHRNPSTRKRSRDTSTLRNCETDLLAAYGLSAHATSILPSLTLLATTWSASSSAARAPPSYVQPATYSAPFDPDQEHAFLKADVRHATNQIDQQLNGLPVKEERDLIYAHFVCLMYQHRKLAREYSALQNLCCRYEREKEAHHREPPEGSGTPTAEGKAGEAKAPHDEGQKESYHVHQRVEEQTTVIQEQKLENESLKKQIKLLQDKYNTRERQIATEKKAAGLEIRLRQAKATQQVKLSQQQVLVISEAYQQRLREAQNNERDIQSHLKQYTEKFEQFQDTLSKSNEIFATFKQEMERMTKTIARLEKDRSFLQAKCEQTDITLIEMAEERNNQRKQLEVLQTKNTRLGALCRVLQAERKREDTGAETRNKAQEHTDVHPETN